MKRRTLRQLEKTGRNEGAASEPVGAADLSTFGMFWSRLERQIPPELLDAVQASFDAPERLVVRIHPPRGEPSETLAMMKASGWDVVALDVATAPVPLYWEVCARPEERRMVTESAVVQEARVYIMNPSSLLPALALAPEPHHAVLDLCAAPGGKTLHLAALMAGDAAMTGHIAAVEAVKPRFFKLRGQLDRFGANHVRTFLKDGRDVGRATPERFDRVLLDAPCSSEARIKADDERSLESWSPRKVKECQHKQLELLRSGLAALKPRGRLVYCTCSFSFEENEAVLATVLDEQRGAVRLVPTGLDSLTWAHPPALRAGHHSGDPRLALSRRVWPDLLWDGFFVAALEKVDD